MSGSPQRRRARRALAVAGLALTAAVAGGSGVAAGQEGEPAPPSDPSTTSTTTSTTAPPVTVPLPDGDFGILPPGGQDPAAPPPGPLPPEGDPLAPGGEAPLPPELPVVILPDPTPGLNAALADIDVTRARRDLAEADEGRRAAEAALAPLYAERIAAVGQVRAASDRVVAAKRNVDLLAVNALMFGHVAGIEPVLEAPDLADLRDLELSEVVGDELLAQLDRTRTAFRHAVAVELEATDRVRRGEQVARLARASHLQARDALGEAIRKAEEARRQLGPTILGPAVLDTADLVAWYRTYYAADPPMAPIAEVVDSYLRVGGEEGVAGDIAFAQAILETGGFRSGHAQGFNFAGIGAYDACAPVCGFRFPSLDAGVRAHIHLLRAYADPRLTSAQLAAQPDSRVAPERVGVRGCCQRWTQLTGVWATDPNYDRKVLGIYRLMVETARTLDRQST